MATKNTFHPPQEQIDVHAAGLSGTTSPNSGVAEPIEYLKADPFSGTGYSGLKTAANGEIYWSSVVFDPYIAADGDLDGDSFDGFAEEAAGTDPADPASHPAVVDPGDGGDPPPSLAPDVVAFLGVSDDAATVALAEQHTPVITELVRAYTRGAGFDANGAPFPEVRAVILTATARLVANPEQIESYVSGAGVRGGFTGFTLLESLVLNRYRRRAA